jgi:hypothetical protein
MDCGGFNIYKRRFTMTSEQLNDLLYCVEVYIENIGDGDADDPELFARITRLPKILANQLNFEEDSK